MRSSSASPDPDASTPCPVCETATTRRFQRIEARVYRRCDRCMATFLQPDQRPDRETERREYDRHENDPADPRYRDFLARLAVPLLDRVAAGSEGLDYGCGPGPALAALLREAGHRVELWDPLYRPEPETLARRYDFITCTEVIEHMHHPAEEFRTFDRLLRPGGHLGLMTQFQTDDARFAGWRYRDDPTHVVFYRAETLRFVAERLGWTIEIPRSGVAVMRKPAR